MISEEFNVDRILIQTTFFHKNKNETIVITPKIYYFENRTECLPQIQFQLCARNFVLYQHFVCYIPECNVIIITHYKQYRLHSRSRSQCHRFTFNRSHEASCYERTVLTMPYRQATLFVKENACNDLKQEQTGSSSNLTILNLPVIFYSTHSLSR